MFRFGGRGTDDNDDDDAGGGPRHFRAVELDTAVPCRNPKDPAPYPEDEGSEGASFPSLFMPVLDNKPASGLADAELKHSWQRLQVLVNKCLDTGSTPADTVDMVHEFYEQHVCTQFAEAPKWSRKSIYRFVYRDFDRQAAEAINGVNSTVEFLRSQLATRQDDGGVRINSENVKLFLSAVKVHATLVDAKRKREQR